MQPAGLPSIPTGRMHRDNLTDDSTVKALINPNIFTRYGLSHRDFFLVSIALYVEKDEIFE